MLYGYDDTQKIVLLIYEYLQSKLKKQPRTIKLFKPAHEKAVKTYINNLPSTAGADFIWEFFLFQFYTFNFQDQSRKPMPSWFMGKESWNRWRGYTKGARYYVHGWARENKLENPAKSRKFKPVSEDVFMRERKRMSRLAGADFCAPKYGDNPYDPTDEMCYTCPFKSSCEVLFGGEGETVYKTALTKIKEPVASRVNYNELKSAEYDKED